MYRETSLEALEKIEKSGLLRKMTMQIYRVLFMHCPQDDGMTAGEVHQECVKAGVSWRKACTRNDTHSVMSRLTDRGALREFGTRPCKISSNRCITYVPTGKLPGPRRLKDLSPTELVALRGLFHRGNAEEKQVLVKVVRFLPKRLQRKIML